MKNSLNPRTSRVRFVSQNIHNALAIALFCPALASADVLSTHADLLFNWAEATYPNVLTSSLKSQTLDGYYYRGPYTRATGGLFYLGISRSATPHLVMVDADSGESIVDIGTVSTWLSTAMYDTSNNASGAPTTTGTATSGTAESGTSTSGTSSSTGTPPTGTAPSGTPPTGTPPSGTPPATDGTSTPSGTTGTAPTASASGSEVSTCAATQLLDSGINTLSNQSIISTTADTSAVCTNNASVLTLNNPVINTSGNSSSLDNSSFYGLNAGILAIKGSNITVSGGSITTTGSGANGAFATGTGSSISLQDVTIVASGAGGHGVDATLGGALALMNVNASTTGSNGSVIATDRGGGTITVSGGKFSATGVDSAGVYSTGVITVAGASISSGSETVVVEGGNSAVLSNCTMSAAKGTRDRGMLIYQSMSGDAILGNGRLTLTGGSYTWSSTTGPAFYITNSAATIKLTGVAITNASNVLLKASADNWGTTGTNGGTVVFNAEAQNLSGSIVADKISSVATSLSNTSNLTGAINSENTAAAASLSLDNSSTWILTGNSHLTGLTETGGGALTNIISNGFNVYYKSSATANSWLAGATYDLAGGGKLIPE